jgi:hypothetical protein
MENELLMALATLDRLPLLPFSAANCEAGRQEGSFRFKRIDPGGWVGCKDGLGGSSSDDEEVEAVVDCEVADWCLARSVDMLSRLSNAGARGQGCGGWSVQIYLSSVL